MNMKNKQVDSHGRLMTLTLMTGIVGTALQFIPDFELLSFMLTVVVLGSLIGADKKYEEPGRQRLGQSYRLAFEWLFLILLMAYALIVFSTLFAGMEGVVTFLNGHWTGLLLSVMCFLLGVAGLQKQER